MWFPTLLLLLGNLRAAAGLGNVTGHISVWGFSWGLWWSCFKLKKT